MTYSFEGLAARGDPFVGFRPQGPGGVLGGLRLEL